MRELPHCDELFLKFFAPWHDGDSRKRRGFKATFPDVIQHDSMIRLTESEASLLTDEGRCQVAGQIESMVEAAREDWPRYLSVSQEITLDWIDAFDRHYDRDRIHDVIGHSDPSDFGNDYVVLSCEFGATLSHVLLTNQPRLIWRYDFPYWDSSLLDPKTGTALPVFHWAIKKMSEYGVDDGYAAKTKACLQFLHEERKM